jgi:hypothetical protein
MTNREALLRALMALNAAEADSDLAYQQNGGGWGSMTSWEIRSHIREFLAHEFRQGRAPKTEGDAP